MAGFQKKSGRAEEGKENGRWGLKI